MNKHTKSSKKPFYNRQKIYYKLDIYLVMSVICENSIDALRSYSAKKTEKMLNSFYLCQEQNQTDLVNSL